jgi:hypothetical protein
MHDKHADASLRQHRHHRVSRVRKIECEAEKDDKQRPTSHTPRKITASSLSLDRKAGDLCLRHAQIAKIK